MFLFSCLFCKILLKIKEHPPSSPIKLNIGIPKPSRCTQTTHCVKRFIGTNTACDLTYKTTRIIFDRTPENRHCLCRNTRYK